MTQRVPIVLASLAVVFASAGGAAQRPDSAGTDSAHAQLLRRVVISGARLAATTDPRLPLHAEPLALHDVLAGPTPLVELLQRVPGVSVSNDQGSRAQPTMDLRGFALSPVVGVPQGVSVFLDGVRMNEPDAQEVNFDLLPMDAVASAELLPGASAVFGKNTLAGSLNLQTARGGPDAVLRGSVGIGAFGDRQAHLVGSGERGGLDGLVLLKGTTDDGYQSQSGAKTRQVFATVGRRSAGADLALSLLYARDRIYQAGSLPESWIGPARRANYTGGDFFAPELLQLNARGGRAAGAGWLRATVFGRRNAIEQLNVNAGGPNTRAFVRNESVGATVEISVASHAAGLPIEVSAGADAALSRVRYHVLAEAGADGAVLPPDCEPLSPGSALCEDARVTGHDVGLYLQSIVQATDRVSVLLSARGDHARVPINDLRTPANSGTSAFWRLSPKVGLTYVNGGGTRLYALAGSAFRTPAPLELACASPDATCPLPFSLGADPPLKPVVAWSYEAGAEWSPRSGTTLSISLFDADVRDEIVFVGAERAAGYFQNVDRTRRDGVELSFSALLPGDAARLFGSYTLVDATYRTAVALASALEGNDVTPGDRFALSPRHRGTLGIELVRNVGTTSVDAALSVRAVSSAFLRGDEANRTAPLPAYGVADLRLGIRRERAALSAVVANLLDRRYVIYGVYATNPKGPYGGPPPATPPVERFLTPAYPRTLYVTLALER